MTALQVVAPLAGELVPLVQVPDEVFAAEMVGPGVAIDPGRAGSVTAVAPISGQVLKMHSHAFVLVSGTGRGVLVHLGIDTVQLDGQGFTMHVAEGDQVRTGQGMVTFSPQEIADGGRSPVCPVIALDATAAQIQVETAGFVESGADLLLWK